MKTLLKHSRKGFIGESEIYWVPGKNGIQEFCEEHALAAYIKLLDKLDFVLRDRCIFCARNGWIGVGPNGMRKGDLVYILKDCPLPVLLRPEDDHFLLPGTTLIHGLRDGEMMAESDRRSTSIQEFKIW